MYYVLHTHICIYIYIHVHMYGDILIARAFERDLQRFRGCQVYRNNPGWCQAGRSFEVAVSVRAAVTSNAALFEHKVSLNPFVNHIFCLWECTQSLTYTTFQTHRLVGGKELRANIWSAVQGSSLSGLLNKWPQACSWFSFVMARRRIRIASGCRGLLFINTELAEKLKIDCNWSKQLFITFSPLVPGSVGKVPLETFGYSWVAPVS